MQFYHHQLTLSLFVNMEKLCLCLLAVSFVINCDADLVTRTGNGSHQGHEGRLLRNLLDTGYDVRERPFIQDGGPVLFNLTLYLTAISNLDARTQVLSGISWLAMDWYDNRLTWDPEDYAEIGSFTVNIDHTWSPKIYLQNTVLDKPENPIQQDVSQTYITYDGRVHLESPLLHHTSCDLNLHKFPFDEQECWLLFTTQNQPIHLVRVGSSSVVAHYTNISSEWDIVSTSTRSRLVTIQGNITYEVAEMGIKLKRLPRFYVQNVTAPIAFLSWLAIIIFLVPAKSGERLSASISLVLGLTVFQIIITDNMPKNSRGESAVVIEYVSNCFVVTIAVAIMSAIVINLSHREGCIHNKLIRTVFFDYLGPWCLVGGCCSKKALGSNPNGRRTAGDLEMKDTAGKTQMNDNHHDQDSPQLAWVNKQSTGRFDEQAQCEIPKVKVVHDFELLAQILDRIFMFATLVSLTTITLTYLIEV